MRSLQISVRPIWHDGPTGQEFVWTLTEFDPHSDWKCLPPRRPRQCSPAAGTHPDRQNRSAAGRFGPSKGEYYSDRMRPSYNIIDYLNAFLSLSLQKVKKVI